MFHCLLLLAQDTVLPSSPSVAVGVGAAATASVTAVWAWFRGELNDCKKDRADLYRRVDELHDELNTLSLTVGRLEGQFKGTTHVAG